MASRSGFSIHWLDATLAEDGKYLELKLDFQVGMAPAAANFDAPIDPINDMICSLRQYAAPIKFAPDIPKMLEQIEKHSHDQKNMIFICSGSLGEQIIPTIVERGWPIHSYYIFCFDTVKHSEWAFELLESGVDIQMFDFQLDLLIRLARDLSNKMIEQGRAALNDNPRTALLYFECALTLAETAVRRDTPSDPNDTHRPSTKHRAVLEGEDGLIAKAKRACGRERNMTLPNHTDDELSTFACNLEKDRSYPPFNKSQ